MEIPVTTFAELMNELKLFLNVYEPESLILCPTEKVKDLKPINERTCRFCGRSFPETTFKNEPHVIPHLLGNKYMISDFECDSCNATFGRFENDLAYFLGIIRTIQGVSSKNKKVPTFKSPGELLVARRTDLHGVIDGVKIDFNDPSILGLKINSKTGMSEIQFTKQPYVPFNVYKALLKTALSIIPSKYVNDYKRAYQVLVDNDDRLAAFANVIVYELPLEHKVGTPVCFLFEKKDKTAKTVSHIFALYFQNTIFQFPIPLFEEDINIGMYDGKTYEIPTCPPLLLVQPENGATFKRQLKDFSSLEKTTEEASMSFYCDPDTLKNLKAFDPKTGTYSDTSLEDEEIVSIYIAPIGSKMNFS